MTTSATQPAPVPAAASPDPDRFFCTDHLMADLKGRSVRGGAVTLSSQAVKFALQTGSTMILARLLTPADFGLVAMVAAFTGFVELFKDLGLSMATVQREKITHEQVSTLFWINVALSVFLMLVAAVISPLVAWFYGEPRLTLITLAVAATFIFGGLTAQHTALLRRQMHFGSLALIEICSMGAGLSVAVTLASFGARYWALVAMGASTAAASMLLTWVFSGWRPGLPSRGAGVRPILGFGANVTGYNLLNYVIRNLDNILIGWWWGQSHLGVYAKSYSLLLQPLRQISTPISSVALPTLSRLANNATQYAESSLRLVRYSAVLTCPLAAAIFAMAGEIVILLFGDQWIAAVPIVRWLSVAAVSQMALSQVGVILVARHRVDVQLHFGIVNCLIVVVGFVVALPYGPASVAMVYALSGLLIRSPILLFVAAKACAISPRAMYGAVFPSIMIAVLVSACCALARTFSLQYLTNTMTAVCVGSCYIAAYVLAIILLPCIRESLRDIGALIWAVKGPHARSWP